MSTKNKQAARDEAEHHHDKGFEEMCSTPVPAATQGQIKIVVLDRGFVFVGRVTQTDTEMFIDDARCIRKWGTTEGLGQLKDGPLNDTVLDAKCTVRPQLKAVMFTIDCHQSKWEPSLKG